MIRVISELFIATFIGIFFCSCSGDAMHTEVERNFSSLSAEQEFWNKWIKANCAENCLLSPFFLERDIILLDQINNKLVAINRASKIFVLVIRINVDNGIFEIIALAKDKNWQEIRWNIGDGVLKESIIKPVGIQDNYLKNLSGRGVDVDASDIVFDATSIYMFIRYDRKCSRFAIYNYPQSSNDVKSQNKPLVVSLKTLLQNVGIEDD